MFSSIDIITTYCLIMVNKSFVPIIGQSYGVRRVKNGQSVCMMTPHRTPGMTIFRIKVE